MVSISLHAQIYTSDGLPFQEVTKSDVVLYEKLPMLGDYGNTISFGVGYMQNVGTYGKVFEFSPTGLKRIISYTISIKPASMDAYSKVEKVYSSKYRKNVDGKYMLPSGVLLQIWMEPNGNFTLKFTYGHSHKAGKIASSR